MKTNTEPVATPIACEHGQLARVCEICELKLELDAERERAGHWEEEARRYCCNSDYWRERAEKAEAQLAALKEAKPNSPR